ncbi:flagellar brake protein [Oceanospirillum sanctuarii]|uniref:flagellar brake protein n=1 Tax=Oceanospirillum sanctuarii TaxID=1434821 RepID=UPI000A36A8BA|nr:flagellar brake protein [Oceanospirillum sanctuarii]
MATETPNAQQDNQSEPQGQLLTKPESIYGLLNRLKDHHIPLKLHFNTVEGVYSTIILKVDLKNRHFIVDQVSPNWGDRVMAKSGAFMFEAYYDGCRIASSTLKAVGKGVQDGQAIYKIPFPDELDYFQRRQFYRAQIRRGVVIDAIFDSKDFAKPIVGELKDISAQGCQIEIDGDYREILGNQAVLDSCSITFPNQLSIVTAIQVRHVGYDEKTDRSSCGCLFVDLPPMEERKVSYAVAEIQREVARRSSDGSSRYISPLYEPKPLEEGEGGESAPAAESSEKPRRKKVTKANRTSDSNSSATTDEDNSEELVEEVIEEGSIQSGINELKQQKEKAKLQELFKEFRLYHTNAIACVKGLLAQLKQKQTLKLQPAFDVSEQLASALEQNPHVLLALTTLRDAQDYIPQHSVSFGIHLAYFAKSMGYTGSLADLIMAGLVHDLGKNSLPSMIMFKPDRLTPQELKTMQRHVITTHKALTEASTDLPKEVMAVVLGNTERLDGNGYPRKLKADKISGLARMAAIVDAYDAMTTDRNYAKGMLPALAFKTLMNSDKQFDRLMVQRFIKCVGLMPVGSFVRLSSNKLGFVLTLDPETAKPAMVRVIYDADKKQLITPDDFDLTDPASSASVGTIVRPEDPSKYFVNRLLMMD